MAKTRSEYYTRNRLLNRLGLFQEPLPKSIVAFSTSPSSRATSTTTATITKHSGINGSCTSFTDCQHPSSHGSMAPFEMKLKDASWQQDEQETNSMGRSSCASSIDTNSMESCEQNQQPHHRHVHFKETTSVLPIPSRYQYSERIKQQIWSNRFELREMAQRNMMEFESEGFDWKNVVLEEDMYIDAGNGNYVHPCHVRQTRRPYPQISSMRIATPDGKGGTITRSLQEVLGNNEDDDDDDEEEEEAEDEPIPFAPLRRLDAIVVVSS